MWIENGKLCFTEEEQAYLDRERERTRDLPMWYVHPAHRRVIKELADAEVARRNAEERKIPQNYTYWYTVTDNEHYPGEFIITHGRYAM